MHKFFLVFSLILSSCASSPVQEKGNIDKVNKIINTSPIKKPIRRTTKQSEELITKIESIGVLLFALLIFSVITQKNFPAYIAN